MSNQTEDLAALLKALGDPIRLQIATTLAASTDSVCVCDITSLFTVSQPTVSHHLKVLRDAGMVTAERHGTWMHYTLPPRAKEIITAILSASGASTATTLPLATTTECC
ncbi:helix-turn-helix transcriptional regulator [Hoyosella sp. G463]|uniref:Helix-turn-helix transcriptional regulator n=1 Tax=Lolliginicoccus lacisalsi TaxID=2742202 RepID=A0A927JAS5_9ACTN|nr:metalloregulator ArsR/SmtB family transcription factor [Lolliginicoccus lacisalsi]MBD8505666.1 helix-turn-helix transcriptional regulator [Lolliginicoccus lacisalsi]